jgi:hypothetical protein
VRSYGDAVAVDDPGDGETFLSRAHNRMRIWLIFATHSRAIEICDLEAKTNGLTITSAVATKGITGADTSSCTARCWRNGYAAQIVGDDSVGWKMADDVVDRRA